ncbi:hypothetical protein Droror1_Dr00010111 [Drosera rotundifolia]
MSHPHGFGPPSPMQFRPPVPSQQGQSFLPVSSLQYHSAGSNIPSNGGMPNVQNQGLQYSQPMQQMAPRPTPVMTMPYVQYSRSLTPGTQSYGNHVPVVDGQGFPPSSSYTFQSVSQMQNPLVPSGMPWSSSGPQGSMHAGPFQQPGDHSSTSVNSGSATGAADATQSSGSDWQEHASSDGRRYYYNKVTRESSWDKPLELMTPLERADALSGWKEFTTEDGRKYYHNKATNQSKWTIPEELKVAREQAEKAANNGIHSTGGFNPLSSVSGNAMSTDSPSTVLAPSATMSDMVPTSIPLPLAVSLSPLSSTVLPASSSLGGVPSPMTIITPPALASVTADLPSLPGNNNAVFSIGSEKNAPQELASSEDAALALAQDLEEAKKGMAVAGKVNETQVDERTVDDEPLVFASKQDAKNAFKSLLESANVPADWTWDQAMRVIINDKRFGALKTLGERKAAFNEYLGQRRKQEAEERRIRQKKAKEEFIIMMEESKELTSSMRWSKAMTLFEEDDRFKAVEKPRDREELFENYIVELQKKEKVKAQEEYRKNREDFRKFLESCDSIKVTTLWRKVQDQLEDDVSCSRLEKIDRLEIFQDYIRDLEKEEEEQKKTHKELLRRTERKNRDAFRKLLEDDVEAGIITAKTHWHEYCAKVKESSTYLAVARNSFGSTPKDLFEDVVEGLEDQYHSDKSRVKDALKQYKVTLTSTWTYEEFKASIIEEIGSPSISDINLELVFEELLERVKEKEEKEAKRRQRLIDDFTDILHSLKELTVSSTWEDSKELFEDSEEYRAIEDDNVARGIFEDYIILLQEKAKEKERKREEEKVKKEKEKEEKEKRKEKERKEKEREREREKKKERSKKDETDSEIQDERDEPRREKDKEKEKKHRKRHHDKVDDINSDRDEKEEHKKHRRHSSDKKKSRKHEHSESDSESRHKRHKKDHRDNSRKNDHEELEDGEVGEDGEIQ